MDEQEKADLEKFKSDTIELKVKCFDYMRLLSRLPDNELKNAGHTKGTADAVLTTLKDSLSKINKLQKEYLMQYPD